MLRGCVATFLGSGDSARELGRRGSAQDIVFYNAKKGEVVHTYLLPARYPERIVPLGYALSVSGRVIFEVGEISASLGESIIAARASGKERADVVLSNYMTAEQVESLFKEAGLFPVFHDDMRSLRLALEDEGSGSSSPPAEGAEGGETGPLVVVDQSFPVKGVGTVVLGFVTSGVLERHMELHVTPGGRRCLVRSIQVQDADQEAVGPGARVGLALRGVEPEDVPRGSFLSLHPMETWEGGELTVAEELSVSPYFKKPLEEGMVVHLVSGFFSTPARLERVEDGLVVMRPEKPVVRSNLPVLVFHLDAGKQRVVGSLWKGGKVF
ncbi:MAG: hypothetical protein J7L61_00670 [Thermoplasmata archaeon]|nr:hypothetical protein [Thermoplasmata archaeon]